MIGLISILALLTLLYFVYRRQRHFDGANVFRPSGTHWLRGDLEEISLSSEKIVISDQIIKLVEKYPKERTIGAYFAGSPHIITSDLHIIQDVFFKKFDTFHARWEMPLQPPGDHPKAGVFNAYGASWKRQRSVVNQVFLSKHIRTLFPVMKNRAFALLGHIHQHGDVAARYGVVEFYPMINNYAIDVMARSLMCDKTDYQKNTKNVLLEAFDRFFTTNPVLRTIAFILPELNWLFCFLAHAIDEQEIHRVGENVYQVVKERLTGETHNDMVQHLVDSMTPMGERRLTDDEVIVNTMVLLFAGSDTQSGALTILVLLMAQHPRTIVKLQKEIDKLWDGAEATLTYDKIQHMTYAEALIKESMRLYPVTAATHSRRCMQTCVVGSGSSAVRVEKGVHVTADTHTLHRRKDMWGENADEFRPERWLEESGRVAPAICFMPFGAGRRACPGQRQAFIQMKCVLAVLFKHLNLEKCAETPTKMHMIGSGAPYPEASFVKMTKRTTVHA